MLCVCVKNSVYVLKATASMLAVQLLRSDPSGQEGKALPELPEERLVTTSIAFSSTTSNRVNPTSRNHHLTVRNIPQNSRTSKLKANQFGAQFKDQFHPVGVTST